MADQTEPVHARPAIGIDRSHAWLRSYAAIMINQPDRGGQHPIAASQHPIAAASTRSDQGAAGQGPIRPGRGGPASVGNNLCGKYS